MTKTKTKPKLLRLSSEERNFILKETQNYSNPRAALIDALKIVQHSRGWVPDGAILLISDLLGINPIEVEEVATFYSKIYRQPVGRHVIMLCDSITCYMNGYETIRNWLNSQLGIKFGQTTTDNRFTLLPVCCLGNCDKSPTMMVDLDTHSEINCEKLIKILGDYT